MSAKKWNPWNWFKKEEDGTGAAVPVRRAKERATDSAVSSPLANIYREIDHLFDRALRGFGTSPFEITRSMIPHSGDGWLKPTLDLGATDNEYTISVEIPGVDEKDVKLEILNDILTIQGEKKHENEDKGKDYYRMERSYGSFQRTLSLPDDVDQENVTATFKNGVLTVNMPRTTLPQADVKQIEVKSA